MPPVRIMIVDRKYSSWTFHDIDTTNEAVLEKPPKFQAADQKLFSKDVIEISEDGLTATIMNSQVRSPHSIYAGVLQLDSNKTYGRTENKKRLLYKCIPDDVHLPAFLVPYEMKIGFEKKHKNKYVVFRYDQWTGKHPQGLLVETLGDVDSLGAFYEYQLYCKSLHASIAEITAEARANLNKKTHQEYISQICQDPRFSVQDRRQDYVFTIDPPGSMDFDDGFSFIRLPDGRRQLSIHIAHVSLWLDALGLWKSFSKRVSTIYLPDRRRPMLPTVLSDALCSLQEGQPRFAFTMDVIVGENGELDPDQIMFSNTLIEVKKNYRYEECAMYDDKMYIDLFNLTKTMDKTSSNSHDVVGFWMVYMNKVCAKRMVDLKIGIFRSVLVKSPDVFNKSLSESLTPDCKRVIQTWHNTTGQYVAFSDVAILDHQIMNESSYVHITSPIRRLVDLLNQMLFLSHGNPAFLSKDAAEFLDKWMSNLEYVNTSMRSIRKVQTDCDLLHKCSLDPNIMKTVHDGIIFDMISKNDKSVTFMVYLEDLKLLSRVVLLPGANIKNYTKAKFRLYLFEDEDKTKRKIRLQMV